MAEISFLPGYGSISVKEPKNELSPGVKNPGDTYMKAAHEVLRAVQQNLAARGDIPAVEDVAHHLKKLFPGFS